MASVGKDVVNFSDNGLTPNTTYTYKVYAYNNVGASLSYSNEVTVNTSSGNNTGSIFNPNLTYGNVSDNDGNTYKTIQIGTQLWMAENLRTTKYRDGSNIPVVTDNMQWTSNYNNGGTPLQQPMMCWYNNDKTTYINNKMGALYNWYAINPATNGNKNVCPTGWHVPSDGEWTTLTNFQGGEPVAGGKMKTTGTQYWLSPNQDATNSSGFSGLPGGFRFSNGSFNLIGSVGYWWSSTEDNTRYAWYRFLEYFYGIVTRNNYDKPNGYSVRCLRD